MNVEETSGIAFHFVLGRCFYTHCANATSLKSIVNDAQSDENPIKLNTELKLTFIASLTAVLTSSQ